MRLSLPIALDRPCDADWSAMSPRDRDRFCSACERMVHDLSSMSAEEARAALTEGGGEGGLCVRYLYDASGRVLHRGDELGGRTVITMRERASRTWLAAASVALAAVVLEACGGARMPREDLVHAEPEDEPDPHGMDAGVQDEPTSGGSEPSR